MAALHATRTCQRASHAPLRARGATFIVQKGLAGTTLPCSSARLCKPKASISFTEVMGQETGPVIAVEVYGGEAAVAARLCEVVASAAAAAIADHGAFFLAVPGGSVLKMCAGLTQKKQIDWSKVHLFYVNHKCVPPDDKSSTHFKALGLFIDAVGLPAANVATLRGTPDAPAEAAAYEAALRQVAAQRGIELTEDDVPRFDLMLLGMGSDGHVGSLYPGRPETTMAAPGTPLVLPVDKKQPASITLSLPVMCAARKVVVAMTGASKADAVWEALQSTTGAAGGMPARLARPAFDSSSLWLMDAPAASKLEVATAARALLATDGAVRTMRAELSQ